MSNETQNIEATELIGFDTTVLCGSSAVKPIQIPINIDGVTRTLTVCPHVVRELMTLETNLWGAHNTLEWILSPEKRKREPEMQSYPLNCLLEYVGDDERELSFCVGDKAGWLLYALRTSEKGMRKVEPGSYISKDNHEWEIEGLPDEVHAEPDASCCTERYKMHLAAVAAREAQEAKDSEEAQEIKATQEVKATQGDASWIEGIIPIE